MPPEYQPSYFTTEKPVKQKKALVGKIKSYTAVRILLAELVDLHNSFIRDQVITEFYQHTVDKKLDKCIAKVFRGVSITGPNFKLNELKTRRKITEKFSDDKTIITMFGNTLKRLLTVATDACNIIEKAYLDDNYRKFDKELKAEIGYELHAGLFWLQTSVQTHFAIRLKK